MWRAVVDFDGVSDVRWGGDHGARWEAGASSAFLKSFGVCGIVHCDV